MTTTTRSTRQSLTAHTARPQATRSPSTRAEDPSLLQAAALAPAQATPDALLTLQRMVGNRAVGQMMSASTPSMQRTPAAALPANSVEHPAPGRATGAWSRPLKASPITKQTHRISRSPRTQVQRFYKVPAASQTPTNWAGTGTDLRVADDARMAVQDSAVFQGGKVLYALPSVISDAKNRLAAVESPYTLDEDNGTTIQGKVPGSGGILKSRTLVTLSRAIPRDTRKGGPTGSSDALKTIEACSAHGLDFMGVGTEASQQKASNRVAKIAAAGQNVVNTGATTGKNATSDIDARNLILIAIARREQGLADDAPNPALGEAKTIYQGLSEKKKSRYAREYQINQFAQPEVGEGVEAMRAAGEGAKDSFPMHFAPVIAKSGSDYVALENYAKKLTERGDSDTSSASGQWYFRMYGPMKTYVFKADDDQSYYGQHAAEGSIGDREDLMGLRNQNKAKDEN